MKVFRKIGVSTLINILGMSVAFAAAMILMVQVRWDTTYDRNYEGHEKVYRMETDILDDGQFAVMMCRPYLELFRGADPNIEEVGTVQVYTVETNLNRLDEKERRISLSVSKMDSSMFSIYPFEWKEGSAADFTADRTAVISAEYARMFFDGESAVGQVLETEEGETVRIVGVYDNIPRNCTFHSDMIMNLGDEDFDNENEWSYSGYLKLSHPLDDTALNTMIHILEKGVEGELYELVQQAVSSRFRIRQLHDAHYERDVRAGVPSANKAITVTLAVIAILLILIAIINFINFAFAEIPFRIKSINTRKVLGAGRGSLIARQLAGACGIALAALLMALLLVHLFSGTSLASFVSGSLKISDNVGLTASMLGVVLFSAVAAGIVPALYSTSQPAALVLKGSYGTSVKGKSLRKALVAIQFILSFLFIMIAMYVGVQTRYMIRSDMGFEQGNILQVECGGRAGAKYEALGNRLKQNPDIIDVTFADTHIVTDQRMMWGREYDGAIVYEEVYPVDVNFCKFFGLTILEGRDFQNSDNLTSSGTFIVNETFMSHYPQFKVGNRMESHTEYPGELVGVVKDFNFKSLQHAMGPLALYNWGREKWRDFSIVYVKTTPDADFKSVSKYIRETIAAFDPLTDSDKLDVTFLDNYIREMYDAERALARLILIASLVALFIAIIGIIGLVFFETQFLKKEIAVRRVNGATVGSILKMINKKYLIMAGVSFVIAAPIAYYLMTAWRKGFAYQAPVPVWIFVTALILVAAITVAVITLQSWHAASANPVESLKNE